MKKMIGAADGIGIDGISSSDFAQRSLRVFKAYESLRSWSFQVFRIRPMHVAAKVDSIFHGNHFMI